MVQLVKHDLEFILKQIKIAEAHAAGGDLATLVAGYNGNDGLTQAHLLPYGLRTVDGSYNNLLPGRENWGASDQSFPGLFDPTYINDADGDRYDFNPLPDMETWYSNNDYANAGTRSGSQPGPGSGTVVDADPRIISNLIVDQTLDNPAAIATALTHAGLSGQPLMNAMSAIYAAHKAGDQATLESLLTQHGVEMDGNTVYLPNVSPDEGLSSPFNGWMTIFGQFFDHGLDLVAKGGNGTVYVPLAEDDPLYVPGGQNYIPLTRVTVDAGPDGRLGTADDAHSPTNLTTPWVDQNQTYGSTASKQVFMREYVAGPDGTPIATGHLLEGSNGGLATWADIKAQAKNVLGIELTDLNVGNIPLIASDAYGNFIPGPNGYPQLVVGMGPDGVLGTADDVLREGNPAAPVSAQGVVLTGHAFIDDIAHVAAPIVNSSGALVQDSDTTLGYANADGTPGPQGPRGLTAYDNELLDRHFVAGDGRANENIALTAVHQVFHSEHNRVVEMTKTLALESNDLAFLNEWLLVDVAAIPTTDAGKAALVWDGDRLFQAGRFTNEMEYQHLVFEEFGRMMQPDIDAFVFEPSADINPSIAAEFAHVVYRFGHSMLRQDISIIEMDENGNPVQNDVTLFEGFLNPVMYDSLGSAEEASGAIIRGMSRQTGSEIDEFVTDVLRNQLLGVPLDLATINIARGRDVGTPSLNAAREKFFAETGDTLLKPYESWADFALNLKNTASIINFVAAYGTHATLANPQSDPKTIEELREAATLLVMGGAGAPTDRLDFLNARGAYAGGTLGGLNTVDFWMGGLAEKKMAFGGMLGSTFSFVFQMTMENLQDADRFYYLSRAQGLNLLNELENNTFAELVMRNTDLGEDHQTALPGNLFSAFDMPTLEMDISKQLGADPVSDNPFIGGFAKLVERQDWEQPTSITVAGVPSGMTFNPSTLSLTGAADTAGTYTVVITAHYPNGITRSHEVEIVVSDPQAPQYPVVEPIALTPDHLDALVDDEYYLEIYPDVANAGMDADTHWTNYGAAEGRSPNAFFSREYYLAQNPDVASSGVDPLTHYATIGWLQGRNPSAAFDVQKYLEANPDVAAAGMDPLYHYLAYGRGEHRAIYAVEPPVLNPVDAGANDPVVELAIGQTFSLKLPANFFRGDGITDYLRINSNEHFTIGGTEDDDTIISGGGDDAIWGRGGNDTIEAGYGVDKVFGGEGDDIITNAGTDIGEADFLHGNEGNDVIHGGSGLSLLFGNQGNDFIVTGPDGKEAFAGTGNDFVLGGTGGDLLLGNEGDDWLEGGDRFDTLAGENSELFFNSTIIGHDVMLGGGGDTDYDGESGDDIMSQNSEGIQRSNGMAGFDWAIHKGDSQAANSNLGIPIFATQEAFILRDRFDLVEGLSGWKNNDNLTGRIVAVNTRAEATGTAAIPAEGSPLESYSNALLAKNLDLIAGLSTLVAHVTRTTQTGRDGVVETVVLETADASDILLGGGGSDVITGLAGNDIIDGDKWLNVRIRFVQNGVGYTADAMEGLVYREADYVNGAPKAGAVAQFGGRELDALMFDRTINPGQLAIVREIVDGNVAGNVDTSVYTDVLANYTFGTNSDGSIFVDHVGFVQPAGEDGLPEGEGAPNLASDGRDTIRGIEKLDFVDVDLTVIEGTAAGETLNGTAGADLLVGKGGSDVLNGLAGDDILIGGANGPALSGSASDTFDIASWSSGSGWASPWVEANDVTTGNTVTGGQIRIDNNNSNVLQFVGGTTADYNGAQITRTVNLSSATTATITYSADPAELDPGENVTVQFAADGVNFVTLQTITGNGALVNYSHTVAGPFAANAAIRFVGTAMNATNENVAINNLVINFQNVELLNGGLGNDTYIFDVGDGNDIINEAVNATSGGTADRIVIRSTSIDPVTLLPVLTVLDAFDSNGGTQTGDLVINYGMPGGSTQTITVADHFTGTNAQTGVELINFSNASYLGYALGAGDYLVSRLDQANRTINLSASAANNFVAGEQGLNDQITGGTGNDLLFGGTGDNTLDGGAGDDLLVGGSGSGDNDVLIGGLGADTMVGLGGNDTYRVDDVGDVVVEALNAGIDEVETTLATYTLSANVENLTYTGAATFTGTGNDLANIIEGGAGIDTLIGLGGNDTYIVTGGDIIIEAADGGIDTVQSAVSYTLGANLENLTLTGNGNVNGTGNALNNVITGNSGDNILIGGAGDDIFNLGSGTGNDDVIRYTATGFGNDVVFGFDANASQGQDRIDLSGLGITLANFASRVTITDVEDGTVDDTLITVRDAANVIMGTILLEEVEATGVNGVNSADFILATGTVTGFTSPVEEVATITFAADVITGDANANTLTGTAEANIINGLGGNDTLDGAGGDDVLNGGTGRDVLTGGAGADQFVFAIGDSRNGGSVRDVITDFTSGVDTLDLRALGITDFAAQVSTQKIGSGMLVYVDLNRNGVDSGDFAVQLTGVSALAANDILFTEVVPDPVVVDTTTPTPPPASPTMFGAPTNMADTITGDGDANIINGLGGNDTLDGAGGDDVLNGGTGKDLLTGGTGADQFVFAIGDSKNGGSVRDVITDFTSGEDTLDLRALGITDFAAQVSTQKIGSGLLVYVDLNRNGIDSADFALQLTGVSSLTVEDMLL